MSIRDHISIGDRALLFILVVLGSTAALYFIAWWLDPSHTKQLFWYIPLTVAVFWFFYENAVSWTYLLTLHRAPHVEAPEGLTVDIFTTCAPGEPFEMFARTLPALAAIRYPHTTYLLDGSNNLKLKELCASHGIVHLDCTGIEGAKAGKVNYALTKSIGEFVLVIDPDHVPESHFLDRVLGHFSDPRVGFVQVVQAFYNQDESPLARATAEQTYGFYGPVMMGRAGIESPVVIGANCTFRRSALDSIGGHAVHLIEDFVTSIRLHAKGWKAVYVPEILARGLVPADLRSYFSQHLKWATGMFGVFFGEMWKHLPKLTWWQRFSYITSAAYFFTGLATAVTVLFPIIFLFFNIFAVEMATGDYVLHLIPYIVVFFLLQLSTIRWLRDPSERGLHLRGMVLKAGTWPVYVLGFLYTLVGVEVPYLPTPKESAGRASVFSRLLLPHWLSIVLSIAAMIHAATTTMIDYPGTRLMMLFATVNVVLMAGTIRIATTKAKT